MFFIGFIEKIKGIELPDIYATIICVKSKADAAIQATHFYAPRAARHINSRLNTYT
jgi:hypothetical protein